MPDRWLQIKGDPSVRAFLFQQSRVQSLFDEHIDHLHGSIQVLLTQKGVFHVKMHYSSGQVTCWFADDAYRYRVFVKEEVLAPGFLDQFSDFNIDYLQPVTTENTVCNVLREFKRLRTTDKNIYLRNGSINRINGMIGMNFSCDGVHYIHHQTFFEKLEAFATTNEGICIESTIDQRQISNQR